MKRSMLGAAAPFAMVLAGCASSSGDIASAYVSPLTYANYSCQQLAAESHRIGTRVQQVSGSVDDRATGDAVAMGVALVVFWPALFLVKGDGAESHELARLKGEYEAVNAASIRRGCGMGPTTTTASFARPAAPTLTIAPLSSPQFEAPAMEPGETQETRAECLKSEEPLAEWARDNGTTFVSRCQ